MNMKFAKYYEITELAKEVNPDMFNEYEKIFICSDTNTFWLAKILADYNEDYEPSIGTYMLERNNIEKSFKGEQLSLIDLNNLLIEDDGSNWDNLQCDSLEDALDNLDSGYGLGEIIKVGDKWTTSEA